MNTEAAGRLSCICEIAVNLISNLQLEKDLLNGVRSCLRSLRPVQHPTDSHALSLYLDDIKVGCSGSAHIDCDGVHQRTLSESLDFDRHGG